MGLLIWMERHLIYYCPRHLQLMVVDARMLKDGKLQRLALGWDEENPIVRSMGAHSMRDADVDGDGMG